MRICVRVCACVRARVSVCVCTVLNSVSQKELLRSLKFCSKLSLSVPGGGGGEEKKKKRKNV